MANTSAVDPIVSIPAAQGELGWTLPLSRQFCTRMATDHYENFPVGSRWIPRNLRPHVHAVYAFARSADDFADEVEHEGVRLARLAYWRKLLYRAVEGDADHPVFVALADTVRAHDVPVIWLDHLIRAFEQDVVKSRHPNFESIVDYAKYSANPVGRLVLWLHGYRDEHLFELSDFICSGLQFANFWQDVAVDWKKDRIYLPQDDMKKYNYTETDLESETADQRFKDLMESQIAKTWEFFTRGKSLCDEVGRDLRTELRLIWCGGTRILERIRRNNYDVFHARPTLKLRDKGVMVWRTVRWAKNAYGAMR